jgi:4-hydroxybenzoyl-CoA reductase subunit beta
MMEMIKNKYVKAASIQEAIDFIHQKGVSLFVAGGTDVYVNKQQGTVSADTYIDISGIEELKEIKQEGNILSIGTMVSLENLIKNELIQACFSALQEAASAVATPVIRKTATLGGNILCENRCSFYNQSDWWREAVGYCLKCSGDICIATGGKKNCFSKFVSDTAPVLLACKASVVVIDNQGEREMPLEQLYSGDGINHLTISESTLLKTIKIPIDKSLKVVFKKLRPRKTLDFTSLTTAVSVNQAGNIRIVVGGVDPKPILIEGDRSSLSELVTMAVKKPRVVENDYYSRKYRKEMIGVYVEDSLKELGLEKS